MHTEALDNQGSDICCDEDASIPLRSDQRDIFSSSEYDGSTEHHVDGRGEEERSDEEKDTLGYERTPGLVVEMACDACAETTNFA
jgi:hypothetical protein